MKLLKGILFLLILNSCSYLPENPYSTEVILSENENFIHLESETCSNSNNILIYYPGGLVDSHSYINKLAPLACINHSIFIAKAPANLMVLDSDIAKNVFEFTQDINSDFNYIIAGHSLGGSMACSFVHNNPDAVEGLVLLGSYNIENSDLKAWDGTVLSVIGSNDLVLDKERYTENKSFLPMGSDYQNIIDIPSTLGDNSTIFFELQGGNHSQFGDYGPQNGDGEATISDNEHGEIMLELFELYYSLNGWR